MAEFFERLDFGLEADAKSFFAGQVGGQDFDGHPLAGGWVEAFVNGGPFRPGRAFCRCGRGRACRKS